LCTVPTNVIVAATSKPLKVTSASLFAVISYGQHCTTLQHNVNTSTCYSASLWTMYVHNRSVQAWSVLIVVTEQSCLAATHTFYSRIWAEPRLVTHIRNFQQQSTVVSLVATHFTDLKRAVVSVKLESALSGSWTHAGHWRQGWVCYHPATCSLINDVASGDLTMCSLPLLRNTFDMKRLAKVLSRLYELKTTNSFLSTFLAT